MFQSMVFSAIASCLMSLFFSVSVWGRSKEQNRSGHPIMRYATAPFLMFGCGLIFTAIGVYEWFDPLNQHYSGNLAILSYTPIGIGAFCFLSIIYFGGYLAELTPTVIRVMHWPLSTTEYKLDQLVSVEEKGQEVFLHFRDGRKLAITYMLSGSKHFVNCIKDRRQK
jgi:hypothetical protein